MLWLVEVSLFELHANLPSGLFFEVAVTIALELSLEGALEVAFLEGFAFDGCTSTCC